MTVGEEAVRAYDWMINVTLKEKYKCERDSIRDHRGFLLLISNAQGPTVTPELRHWRGRWMGCAATFAQSMNARRPKKSDYSLNYVNPQELEGYDDISESVKKAYSHVNKENCGFDTCSSCYECKCNGLCGGYNEVLCRLQEKKLKHQRRLERLHAVKDLLRSTEAQALDPNMSKPLPMVPALSFEKL